MTTLTMTQQDSIAMFGAPKDVVERNYGVREENGRLVSGMMGVSDPLMHTISVLSDVQELIEMGRSEDARQYLNRAKYTLMETRDAMNENLYLSLR